MVIFFKLNSILFIFILPLILFSNNQKSIDSLLQVLQTDLSESKKLDAYLSLSYLYKTIDAEKCEFYAEKALNIAYKIKDNKNIGNSLKYLGVANLIHGNYDNSIIQFYP